MSRVAIIDYGMCNLDSISRALEECGAQGFITDQPDDLWDADQLILPGVGSFTKAMDNLHIRGFDEAIRKLMSNKPVPLLGICLGMQLLADSSTEGGNSKWLGLIPGEVRLLSATTPEERVPHMGWNEVDHSGQEELFAGITSNTDFYFVHSYHFNCEKKYIVGRTPYCGGFASAIRNDDIIGVQFHPEKSQRAGFRLLKNFLSL